MNTSGLFTVTMFANRPRGDMPGYANAWQATQDDRLRAIRMDDGFDDEKLSRPVISRVVLASTGYHAISRFQQWYSRGHSEEWLTGGCLVQDSAGHWVKPEEEGDE